jgi:xylulokinase
MSNDKYVLAIDLGTSGCKAALVSVHGRVVAWGFRALETRILPDGGAEQDPDDWWDALVLTIRTVMKRSGYGHDVIAMSLSLTVVTIKFIKALIIWISFRTYKP